MLRHVLMLCAIMIGIEAPAFALTLEWTRNTETDLKQYHVYVCKVQGCTSTNIGLDWIGSVPQPLVGIKPSILLPVNINGAVSVVAEDQAGNQSGPSVSLPFSTVPLPVNLPPNVPSGLIFRAP